MPDLENQIGNAINFVLFLKDFPNQLLYLRTLHNYFIRFFNSNKVLVTYNVL